MQNKIYFMIKWCKSSKFGKINEEYVLKEYILLQKATKLINFLTSVIKMQKGYILVQKDKIIAKIIKINEQKH